MLKKISFFVCVFLLGTGAFAQSFSQDRAKFVKEFEKSLNDYGKGDFKDFAKTDLPKMLLESTEFPADYFKKMVETCNLMETKRISPYPEIYNYVFSVYSFIKSKQSSASYTAWHSSVDKMLDSKNIKKFEDFIGFSSLFFSRKIIGDNANFDWYYIGGTYEFLYTDKPIFKCTNGQLACRVNNNNDDTKKKQPFVDSLVIWNTSGSYDPIAKKWTGTGGTITWEKVGLPKNQTSGILKDYEVSTRVSTFSADSVLLTTPYFAKPIKGRVADRAFKINREEDKIYPQFTSYERRLSIKKIKPDVDYDGGFSLMGSSFVGIGFPKEPARMVVYRNGSPFITASSQLFTVSTTSIFSTNTAIRLLCNGDKDSITHPGLDFNYVFERKTVEMTRTKSGNGQSPFFNSYHQVDMYMPKLTWQTESTDLIMAYEIGTSQEQKIARFESKNYFDGRLFDMLQGMEAVHPLVAIWSYAFKHDEYVMAEGKVATALGKTIEEVKPNLLILASYGFITYDTEAKLITVNKKLENFVMAKSGKKDYDNLIFISDLRPKKLDGYTPEQIKKDENLSYMDSVFQSTNEMRRMMPDFGKMSLSSMELNLKAIDEVTISVAQNTVVFPSNKEIILKRDRDFDFIGWLNSGKMELDVLASSFNYKEYKFTIQKTHKSLFRVKPLNPADGKRPIAMLSSINGIVGELFIDHPTNRSGVSPKFTGYPQIKVTKPSYVYYNSQAIYRGTYDSSRFYYTVDPFFMDSLDNFDEKSFKVIGELTSAGIFPKIRQDLTIMPDYSFGFSMKAPPGGYDFYGPGSKYENKIILSNNGLQGAGIINYVHSSSDSKAFTFFPDSTVGLAIFKNTPIEAGVQFPDVTCEAANVTYVPKQNLLKAASTPKYDLLFFNAEAKLRGTAIVKNEGMRGFGLMNFKNATMLSEDYAFKRWDIDADTSGFSLKNQYLEGDEEPIALRTDSVQGKVSFKDRKGEFKSLNGEARLDFPINQYYCTMDKFTWFMDLETIEVEAKGGEETANADLDLLGPNFFSSHPEQDSLQFRAPKAAFNLKEKSIKCSQVRYLDIADARIYPDSMNVTIRKKARMDPFLDAKIVANYITKYHKFVHCYVQITARKKYTGKGIYPYYDLDSLKTDFTMDKIYLDSTGQTVATGKIGQDAKFYLSKQFDYYGDINVTASLPTIIFKGSTRMNHNCTKYPRSWFALDANIDPANIQIPIAADMKNVDGKNIVAGMAWRDSKVLDSLKMYPVFLSPLQNGADPMIISATGLLQYNMDAKEFQIGSPDKLLNRGEVGNYFSLHTETCMLNGDGKIDLGMNYGDVKVSSVGVINYDPKKGETTMNLTSKFEMPLDKGLMQDLSSKLVLVEGLKPLDFNTCTLEQAALEWAGREKADKMKSDYTIKMEMNVPKELEVAALTITGIKLISYDVKGAMERGLITSSETASIVTMYGKPMFKTVPFKAAFMQTYSETAADKFALQINIPTLDYFFDYSMENKDGTMRIITGDPDFAVAVNNIKEDKRKIKNFRYGIETGTIYVSKFLRYFGK